MAVDSGAGRAAHVAAAARHAALRDQAKARSVVVSRLRLATFLPAAALLVWILARHLQWPLIALDAVLFAAFAVLVYRHARIDAETARHEARRLVCDWGRARWDRDWAALPAGDPPAGVAADAHPYAADLDLFGRASLFRWLGPAATVTGSATLAGWLMSPAPADEIAGRQAAVGTLAGAGEWCDELAVRGVLAGGVSQPAIDRFLAWAEGPPAFGRHAAAVHAAAVVLTVGIWLLLLAWLAGVIVGAYWLALVTVGLILSFATAGRVSGTLDRAGGGEQALVPYAALFEHACRVPAQGTTLGRLAATLGAGRTPAPEAMRRLNALLGFGNLRRSAGIFHFPIQALTLWDFHIVAALDRWREASGAEVRGWLSAVAELDALTALARTARDTEDWCVPTLTSHPRLAGTAIGHPLIPDRSRKTNDVTLGPPGTLLLVTGSNMSGKSTLLRAIGLNIVLAQAGARTCAARLSLPPCDLQTSIRVQDSLELGLSYFMAALARLKGVVDAAQHERPGRRLVYLLDEILQGTNSVERALAVRAVARRLLDAGAIGAMTTHDLTLAGEEPLASAAELVHFTETVDDTGQMRFDYQLRPGLATSRNALRLMALIGLEL